jgi:hypothetical protein
MHDALMAQMPEGASHDAATCSVCVATSSGSPEGGQVDTFTAEEVQEAVAQATETLRTRLAAMETAATESETDARIAAVKAEAETVIAEIRSQLDTAVLEAGQAKTEFEAFKADLTAMADAESARVAMEARRDDRLARVKEVASFPEDYLAQNADRFAAMSDEDFDERLAEYASLSSKAPAPAGGIPKQTALVAARETTDSNRSVIKDVFAGIANHSFDPRSL